MIDAHQHFWRLNRNDCVWPTADLGAIHKDYGPSDLAPLARACGVSGTLLVQFQASDRDTDSAGQAAIFETTAGRVYGV
jgi:L-fuconolactonase